MGQGRYIVAGLAPVFVVAMTATVLGQFDWTCAPPPQPPAGWSVFAPAERNALFPPPQWQPDFRGIDRSRIRPVPPPGVHPRIYLTPDDLPELRLRVRTSKAAGVAYQRLCEATADFFHEGDWSAPAKVAVIKEKPTLGGGKDDGFSLEAQPDKVFHKTAMQRLVDGSATAEEYAGGDPRKGKPAEGLRVEIAPQLAMNALRALIDEDDQRGQRVAAALATYGRVCQQLMQQGKSIGAYRPLHALAQAYDYAFPFMSDAQRDVVRQAIATSLTNPYKYLDGAMYGVCHPRPSHNWVSLVTQHILMLSLAIEDEPGYNPAATEAMIQTSENWIHYWWGDNGCSYEGMGKNQLNADHYLALARRGRWLICHPHVRRAIDRFYPAILQPWGYQCTAHSGWGGSANRLRVRDVMALKFIAPEDPVVDFVWRNAAGDDYGQLEPMDVIFATDWTGDADWTTHARAAKLELNYLDPGRAMLCARDRWHPDGLWLQFVCDQQYTAHMQQEIGNFLLTAHGRLWAWFIHANDSVGASSHHSVLLVDGIEQTGLGRMVSQRSNDDACFATADWRPAYNQYVTAADQRPTINDHHPLAPIKAPFADWRGEFDWRNGWLKRDPAPDWRAEPSLELKQAFRTVGLVRGPNPYVLIMDDVQPADGQVHHFAWYMQVPNDVVVASMANREINGFGFLDIVLTGSQDATMPPEGWEREFGHLDVRKDAPCLLVRLLRVDTAKGRHSPTPGVLESYNNVPAWPNTELKPVGKRLRIETWSTAPGFVVLLYPHRRGDELPKTAWSAKGRQLQITFKQQLDTFQFEPAPDGKPRFTLRHGDIRQRRESLLKFGFDADIMEELVLPAE